jgi:L-ascorbate metabolism protein UlaG (beta-lactamase superfamily)
MEVEWLGHATVLIEVDGTRVLTDPVLRKRIGPLIRLAPPVRDESLGNLDAVLLSHLHRDHAQLASLRRVARTAVLIAPQGAGSWLRRQRIENVRELGVGDETEVGGLRIRAVKATHEAQRGPLGPSADPVGFVVRGSGSAYFAGDTDIFEGMEELRRTIDVALLPVWGWGPVLGPGHLDPAGAARAAALIEPRVAIPIHWGTFALPRPFAGRAATDEPAREFAELARKEAPGVEVRLLQPGQRTTVT